MYHLFTKVPRSQAESQSLLFKQIMFVLFFEIELSLSILYFTICPCKYTSQLAPGMG